MFKANRLVALNPEHRLLSAYSVAFASGQSIVVRPPGAAVMSRLHSEELTKRTKGWVCTDLQDRWRSVTGGGPGSLFVFSTSGSSGEPKTVVYASQTIRSAARAIASALSLSQLSEAVSVVPPSYAYGLSILNSHLVSDSPLRLFGPQQLLRLSAYLEAAPPSLVYLLPFQAAQLAAMVPRIDVQHRFAVAGGALATGTARQLGQKFPNSLIHHMYGQSELGPRVAIWTGRPMEYKQGLVGDPLPGVGIRFAEEPPPGYSSTGAVREASVRVRTPFRMLGYLGDELIEDDGRIDWDTGDLGYLDSSGQLIITGRADRRVKFLGRFIDLNEVTRVVSAIPNVLICSVRAEARGALGMVPIVEYVPANENSPGEGTVRYALFNQFGDISRAFRCRAVNELQTNTAGKVR